MVDWTEVISLVQRIHGRPEDWAEGDLWDRVENFPLYRLQSIEINRINMDEWAVNDNYVQELVEKIKTSAVYNPIVFDPENGGSVIDGIHRANALYKLGHTKILAFVGVRGSNATK